MWEGGMCGGDVWMVMIGYNERGNVTDLGETTIDSTNGYKD